MRDVSRDVIAVILGGGAGTRLFPLTLHRSKPAVPLAGKYRLIDIPISNCINSNINRMFVLTQFNSASLNRHIALTYRFDHFSRGFVTILAAEQTPLSREWFQGTADAVRRSLHHLEAYRHSHVLILSGDQLYLMDYREMYRYHCERGADITIATTPVTAEAAPGLGIMKTDDEGRIVEFVEKPAPEQLKGLESKVPPEMEAQGRIYLASMGIYVFNRQVLREELDAYPEYIDFGKEIIPAALKVRKVYSYPFMGYWSDIGTIRSFYEANLMLTDTYPPFSLYNPHMPIYTHARMLPPAKIINSQIVNSMIAEACIILNSTVKRSVIGIRSFVDEGAIIEDTIVMGNDYFPWHRREERELMQGPDFPGIGKGSVVKGAIIDKNVSIGKGCRIVNQAGVVEGEGPGFYIRDGLVVILKNAEIPEGTVI